MSLIAGRNTPFKDTQVIAVPMAANVKIYAGAIVCANATGFGTPGATSTTLTYLGRAEDTIDNTGGVDGAKTITVRRKKMFKWNNLAADLVTQADLGKPVFIVDDETVAKSSGGATRSPAGKVLGVDADGVWID